MVSTHKKVAIKNFARTLPIDVAVVRRPLKRSGSMSITSPKIWECMANSAPNKKIERRRKRHLHGGDLPFQRAQLFAPAARTKHERALPRIQRIGLCVDN